MSKFVCSPFGLAESRVHSGFHNSLLCQMEITEARHFEGSFPRRDTLTPAILQPLFDAKRAIILLNMLLHFWFQGTGSVSRMMPDLIKRVPTALRG